MANFFIITKTERIDRDGHKTLDREVREFPSLEAVSGQMLADYNAYKEFHQVCKAVVGYATGIPSYFKVSGDGPVSSVEQFLIKAEA